MHEESPIGASISETGRGADYDLSRRSSSGKIYRAQSYRSSLTASSPLPK